MAEEEDKAKKGPGLLRYVKVGFISLNFLGIAVGLALVYISTLGSKPIELTEEIEKAKLEKLEVFEDDEPIVYTMDTFKVNLDGVPRRMVFAELNLEMMDEEGFEEVISLGPKARDAIIRIFNSKRFSDLESIQGKLFLKDQIVSSLNGILQKGVVKDVYFSSFYVEGG